jgi:hypothetical protein
MNQRPVERRRHPRIEVALVSSHIATLDPDPPFTLVNVSRDGFLVQTSVDLPLGFECDFSIRPPHVMPFIVRGRVMHGTRVGMGDTCAYMIGVEFVDCGTAEQDAGIDWLIQACRVDALTDIG